VGPAIMAIAIPMAVCWIIKCFICLALLGSNDDCMAKKFF
jgi:hypothetical protein